MTVTAAADMVTSLFFLLLKLKYFLSYLGLINVILAITVYVAIMGIIKLLEYLQKFLIGSGIVYVKTIKACR
jgi:hypothetical protein